MAVAPVAPVPARVEVAWLPIVVEQAPRSKSRMVRQILTIHNGLILFITITKDAAVVQVASMPRAVLASDETSRHRFHPGHTVDGVSP